MDWTGRLVQQRYRVLRPLGEGGMGSVFLVQHRLHPELHFALKVLKPAWSSNADQVQRFRAEAQVLSRLDHPGIVPVYDVFESDGLLCMVMQHVPGESLAERLARQGPMPLWQALPLFKAVLAALDHAHQAGVVHRDVKPSNILMGSGGVPMLCDFGIAMQAGVRGTTGAGTTVGTPAYMSPEQIRTPADVDHRSDLYSAAVVLYEMLTGGPPFGGGPDLSDHAVLTDQLCREPPDPRAATPGLSPALVQVLMKALRKSRDRRMQGGLEFIMALTQAEEAPHGVVAPPQEQGRAGSWPAGTQHRPGRRWAAFVGGPLWLLAQRLYGPAVWWCAAELLLAVLMYLVHAQTPRGLSRTVLVLLGAAALLIWVMPGFREPFWREQTLARQPPPAET